MKMLKIPLPKDGFNLEATLDSGQVFGWTKVRATGPVSDFFARGTLGIPAVNSSLVDSACSSSLRSDPMAARCRPSPLTKKSEPPVAYLGTIQGKPMKISQINGHLCVDGQRVKREDIAQYFDLDFDLGCIYKILKSDEQLTASHKAFKGLRLIRQDPWEALACFIISSNNNVKRIQGIWKNLTEYFANAGDGTRGAPWARTAQPGAPMGLRPGRTRICADSFPSAKQIARTHERTLRQLGLGYRAPFLLHTAQYVSTNPQCFSVIRDSPYEEARERVLAFPGIGPKVADCVLLYGFHKLEAFPVDVWILRAMRKLYFKNCKVSEDKIRRFGQKKWGSHAGYVQQYIFHGIRNGIL